MKGFKTVAQNSNSHFGSLSDLVRKIHIQMYTLFWSTSENSDSVIVISANQLSENYY